MRRKGPWSVGEIEDFLRENRIPIRLACNGAAGHPVLASLWFDWLEDELWCATQRTARMAALLRRDPRCAFEVSVETKPYRGIRGKGVATLHDDRGGEILERLIARYQPGSQSRLARMLRERAATETAIAIEPRTLLSWDYRERMGDAA